MIWSYEPGLSTIFTDRIAYPTRQACEINLRYWEGQRLAGNKAAGADARCDELTVLQ